VREDPWLSPEQQRTWRTFLAMTSALNARIERDLQRAAGMPHAYYLILAMLSEAPGRSMRMHQLADFVQASQSRLSHAISRLEDFGWVRREQVQSDKRGQLAILTEAGFRKLEEAAPSHAETVRSTMFDSLSDGQLAEFREICATVLEQMKDD
jgi:DNA-binding MarR family transcriptional regulator